MKRGIPMLVPVMAGRIVRRILVNFRVRPEALEPFVPAPFRVKRIRGHAIAGICLIRLDQVRPRCLPAWCGLASENAAHRIAVEWDEAGQTRSGVFIPRRDTDSWINRLAGGRVFPGHHGAARFEARENAGLVSLEVTGGRSQVRVRVSGTETDVMPADSIFGTIDEANAFFQAGSIGWSATPRGDVVDGMELRCKTWRMRPLAVAEVRSDFMTRLGAAAEFDSAFLMRDIEHEWHSLGIKHVNPWMAKPGG